MSDQVIRYESEQQFLDYTNQTAVMTGGKVIDLPSWDADPDAYWKAHYEYRHEHPDALLEFRVFLVSEVIEDGVLQRQHVKTDTIMFENADAYRANREYLRENLLPDPGTAVSTEFPTLHQAEQMRALLLQGEPGPYYGIKHRTKVAIIDGG